MGKIKDIFTGGYRRLAWFVTLTTVAFLLWELVGPGNNLVHWIRTNREIAGQEEQMQKYRDEIEAMNQDIKELETNRDSLEKFAREQFGFAAPGEDVYIVE